MIPVPGKMSQVYSPLSVEEVTENLSKRKTMREIAKVVRNILYR
jgi:hypothetical protein